MKGRSNVVVWAAAAIWMAAALLVRAGETVTLAWDPSPSSGIARYQVYFGTNSGSYAFTMNAGLVLTNTVELPRRGRWFFAVTAIDTDGIESGYSNRVEWEIKPDPPVLHSEWLVRIIPVLLWSTNLENWATVRAEPTPFLATNSAEFFQVHHLAIEPVNRVE